ncbi:MAG: VanW family protein, partial [Thermomicrobia bacterium]|nr:VanW family protein [Thermomicrobia bacterium]
MAHQREDLRESSASSTAPFAVQSHRDTTYPAASYASEPDGEDGFSDAPPFVPGAGRSRRRRSSRPLIIGLAAVAALFVGLIGCLAFSASLNGKLYDNVYVNNQNLGGLTPDAARAALNARLDPYRNAPVTLTNADMRWTPNLAELGLRVDVDRTVDEAYRAGRSGGPLGRIWRAVEMKQGAKQYVPLYVQLDDQALVAVATIPLPVTFAQPAVTTEAAGQAKARAEALVAQPLTLTFNDKKWDVTRDQLVAALRFNANLDPHIDAAALMPQINAIAAAIKQDPQNAVIGWDNQLVVRQSAKNGQRLNVEETANRINAWTGDVRTLALPVEVTKPRITDDVGALGITTRLGVGVSNFSGSDAARATNIKVAAGYLDDTVVAPGEVFSFLDAIGEISAARGYKDGYVILAEQTVPGIGGGICQVATTMFRAAMYSGLPIEERNPHAYIVSYYQQGGYPIGLDAAVFSPGVDFKFRNETDKYM